METFKKIITWLIFLAILGGLGYWGYNYWMQRQAVLAQQAAAANAAASAGPMPMPVANCIIQDVTDSLEFTGTTEAVNTVEVRARVEGYLKQIHFTDGMIVEKGQLLFTIEPETYIWRRDEASARLESAQAELQRAKLDLERIEKAARSGAVSDQDLTNAKAVYDTAQAAVLGYKAALDKAKLDLGYTKIHSPITGRVGKRFVDAGNLVGAGERTVLTTIIQTEPMYVAFHIGETLLEGQLLPRLQAQKGSEQLKMFVGTPSGNSFPYEGIINYLDNTVDPKTGTIYVRGELANESSALLPGMFVQVKVPIAEIKDAVLIPEKAIFTDLGGKYVLVLGEENILQRRNIELGATLGELRVIIDGLDGTETFVIGSFHIARAGMPITPISEKSKESENN